MTRRDLGLFVAVAALWGVPYLFIKVAIDGDIPPMTIVFSRVLLGALLILPFAIHRGAMRGIRTHLPAILAVALADVAVPFILIVLAEREISSSLAGILVASTPLWVALLALRFDHSERMSGVRLVGLFAGFAGVIALLGGGTGGGSLDAAVMMLLASLGYAIAPMVVKQKLAGVPALGITCASLCISSVLLAVPAALDPPTEMPGFDAFASVVVLGVFCTALAFILFYALVARVGSGRATLITYVSPIFSLAAGIIVLGEGVEGMTILGLVLILAGSWAAAGQRASTVPSTRSG
jgi:drug/metabolite transporter (DMT)-like permease